MHNLKRCVWKFISGVQVTRITLYSVNSSISESIYNTGQWSIYSECEKYQMNTKNVKYLRQA